MIRAEGRRSLLIAAVGFALVDARAAELRLVRSWLDTWIGIGHVITGMHRQGYDVQLTQYDERGWRATFYVTGMEHSARRARRRPRGKRHRGVLCNARHGRL